MKAKTKKPKKKTKKVTDFLSQEGPMRMARIVTYLRCKDAGLDFSALDFGVEGLADRTSDKETIKLIKSLSKSELESYKRIAGVGKYRPKQDPNAPKRCQTCGHYPPAYRGGYGSGNFPSRMDTYQQPASIIDVIRDQQTRDAYANELR